MQVDNFILNKIIYYLHNDEKLVLKLVCHKLNNDIKIKYKTHLCAYAAANGYLNLLEYAHKNKFKLSIDAYYLSLMVGSLECVKYTSQNIRGFISQYNIALAAGSGSLECLQQIYNKSYVLYEASVMAAAAGSLECLKYICKNNGEIGEWTCEAAAGAGSLKCLKYLYSKYCEWSPSTCAMAARANSIRCLRYAYENDCDWDSWTCEAAARAGSLECLHYAVSNGCHLNNACTNAAAAGSLVCLKYAHNSGALWDEKTCEAAVMANTKCGNYIHDEGCELGNFLSDIILIVKTRKYKNLYEKAPWNENLCCNNIQGKASLECLKYLHENRCPWDARTTLAAVVNNSIECLKYAVENGCPIDTKTYYEACSFHDVDMANYIYKYLSPDEKLKIEVKFKNYI